MTLVPNRFLFTIEIMLRHRSIMPRLDGRLTGWSDAERLPAVSTVDGKSEFASLWACWNDDGVAVACRVEGKRSPLRCNPSNYWNSDNLRVCIDTRPSPENKRATRFCRQFYFLPTGGTRKSPVAGVGKFQRAREEAPPVDARLLRVASHISADGYMMEGFMPAECLTGWDPKEHPRLGFYYILEDTDHGKQFLTVGDELLWYADPSTWALARLG